MIDKFITREDTTIKHALERLSDVYGLGLIIVDENQKLCGTVTEGDIRRSLTNGLSLNSQVREIMQVNPVVANKGTTLAELKEITEDQRIKVVPIVDDNKVVDVHYVDLEGMEKVPVILMVGGLGSRLGDLTKDCPKPMLEVGGRPVLERILENFTSVGFKKFYFSVNYKAHMIEDHFGDGSQFGCEIQYLKETKRLGTAGSLSLLPQGVEGPMIVMNGDLLTMVDFRRLIHFHNQHHADLTMCTRNYDFQVPYGVVNVIDGEVKSIEEKPTHSVNVNAGVYVVDAKLLQFVPHDEFFDMPTLVDVVMKKTLPVCCFPMVERWIDIGKVSDLEYARSLYGEN